MSNTAAFLGIGRTQPFIPVDIVTRITTDQVWIGQRGAQVAGAPTYDPHLVLPDRRYFSGLFGYYGYLPYWGGGFQKPGPKSRVLGPFAAGVDATPTDHEGWLGLRSEVSSDGPIGARDVAAQDREAEEACIVHVMSNGLVGHLVLRAHLAGAYFVVPADGRVAAWIVPSEWRAGCASSAIG